MSKNKCYTHTATEVDESVFISVANISEEVNVW
nr:MAG TPA: hypothetical protein [Caudoviricetes sp.]